MEMKKRIPALLLTLVLLLCNTAVFAEGTISLQVTQDNDTGRTDITVSLSDDTSGAIMTLTVLDPNGSVNAIEQFEIEPQTVYNYSYINEGDEGTYTVKAMRTDTTETAEIVFEKKSSEEIESLKDELIASVKGGDTAEIAALLEENRVILEVDLSKFEGVSYEDIAEILVNCPKPDALGGINDLHNAIKASAVVALVNNDKSAETFEKIIADAELGNYLVSDSDAFAILDSDAKSSLYKYLAEQTPFDWYEEVQKSVLFNGLVISVRDYTDWEQAAKVIEKYDELKYLDVDYQSFEKLNNAVKQNAVIKAVKNGDLSEYEAISSAFDKAVKKQNTANTSGNSGGGSGGSSGGVVTSSVPSITTVEVIEKQVGNFDDLEEVTWAKEAIEVLSQYNFVSGIAPRTFEPKRNITRAEFSRLIADAFALPESSEPIAYADVSESDWCYTYISKAAGAGLMNGESDTFFNKSADLTREQAAAVIARAIKMSGTELEAAEQNVFDDEADASSWAVSSLRELKGAGLISGRSGGNFCPRETINRAEAAKLIYDTLRYLKKIV